MSRQLESRGMGSRSDKAATNEIDDAMEDYPAITFASAEENNVYTNSLLPPPAFQSLFTIVTDSTSSEIHHPSVYYVFSDDAENEREGHDVSTFAALTALGDADAAVHGALQDESKADSEPEERFILLDLEPSDNALGIQIQQAQSLSSSWAVTSASLRPAPTLEDEDVQETSVMLTLEGSDLESAKVAKTAALAGKGKGIRDAISSGSSAFEIARKRGNGNAVDGMSELFKQLDHGFNIVDKVSQPISQR